MRLGQDWRGRTLRFPEKDRRGGCARLPDSEGDKDEW